MSHVTGFNLSFNLSFFSPSEALCPGREEGTRLETHPRVRGVLAASFQLRCQAPAFPLTQWNVLPGAPPPAEGSLIEFRFVKPKIQYFKSAST